MAKTSTKAACVEYQTALSLSGEESSAAMVEGRTPLRSLVASLVLFFGMMG